MKIPRRKFLKLYKENTKNIMLDTLYKIPRRKFLKLYKDNAKNIMLDTLYKITSEIKENYIKKTLRILC